MKLYLTSEQMLGYWRLLRGYEPLRSDHAVTRRDGIDLDSLLMKEISAWYSNLLDTAPVEMLVTTDISSSLAAVTSPDLSATVTLPDSCRRLFSIALRGWEHSAVVVPLDENPDLFDEQFNPFTRGCPQRPVAILMPDRTVRLYSMPSLTALPVVERTVAVVEPPDGTFQFDSRALDLIPKYEFMP